MRTAVKVPSVEAEYAWIATNRPGWRVVVQSLVMNGDNACDVLRVEKGGETEDIFFDISSFFAAPPN